MARKIPAEQDKIGAPPYPIADETVAQTEADKAVVETGEKAALAAYDASKPGRDGSGPYTTTAVGVVLPDGSYVPAGGTFCAGAEGVTAAMLEAWQASGLVVSSAKVTTKEFKAPLIAKE